MQRTPATFHKSPDPNLVILSSGHYQARKGAHFRPHSHSYTELVYYRSGSVGCVMEGTISSGYPGLMWITPPGITHAERAVAAYSCDYIAVEAGNPGGWPVFLDDDADGSLGRICQQILVECGRAGPERARMLELLAEQLNFLVRRISSEKVLSRPIQIVSRAERVMEEGVGRPLTIRAVAKAIHVSVSALRGHFQGVRKCSPRDHLRRIRLAKAISFLRSSTLKLDVVAELCGYDSASHLTRGVKKFTGQTPGQIRSGKLTGKAFR